VGRLGAPDARDERQRRHGGSGRTGPKERTLFVQKGLCPSGENGFFADEIFELEFVSFSYRYTASR